ncbi:unnamed protein product [Tuber melanosporum]|uniref:(Perigord truffle) hypothetical protein n=1 Tax=Tuber melanosporum (strain Mel28) TaxID=656061 RepID=D5GCY6_TUBMM|nr:uncharacterized protein GSTUM_00000875001 [Tuber melanosporum]CAZ82379.1 unnamed protein product [Tuber melanosporum]
MIISDYFLSLFPDTAIERVSFVLFSSPLQDTLLPFLPPYHILFHLLVGRSHRA